MSRSMSASAKPYTSAQIALHWAIVALVVVQYLSHDAMEDFWDFVEDGGRVSLPAEPGALLHALSGATILILMMVRIALRLRHGAAPLPDDLSALQRLGAHASHFALYALLIILPLSGASAVLLGIEEAADLHSVLVPALWGLIILHVLAALYHAIWRRDGVFQQMIRSGQR